MLPGDLPWRRCSLSRRDRLPAPAPGFAERACPAAARPVRARVTLIVPFFRTLHSRLHISVARTGEPVSPDAPAVGRLVGGMPSGRRSRGRLAVQEARDTMERVPAVRRRRLGEELRRLRDLAGLTSGQAAQRAGWHQSKVSRIETGHSSVTTGDVGVLLDVYAVRDRRVRDLLT